MMRGAQAVRPRLPSKTFMLSSSSSSFVVAIVVVVLSFCLSCTAAEEENASEALLKFKSSLVNADPALSNWKPASTTPPCSDSRANWIGVMCIKGGNVFGLQLQNMNLKGQIDVDALLPLRALRTLSFIGNSFEGTMPDWRKLGALKSLYLSNNHFSGEIPQDAFKGMSSLKKVHMSNNNFTGHIPVSLGSPKLIELRIENNQFTGTIPPVSSEHLKLLNVSNNQLEGPIPETLIQLDPTSFSGNKALCGKPLESECNTPPPPPPVAVAVEPTPPAAGEADKKKSSPAKLIAIIVASVVVGLLLIILLLFLYQRRRRMSQTPQLGRAVLSPPPPQTVNNVVAATTQAVEKSPSRDPPAPAIPMMKQPQQQQPGPGKLTFVREDRQKFDLQDLMRASAEVLGSGTFGASYKAVLVDGEALVVKRFKQMNSIGKEDFHEHMRRLGRLQHPNLLPLVAYLYRKEEKLLVLDYVHNRSLATYLHGKHTVDQPSLSWAIRLKIIKGVGKGLAYLQNELPTLTVPHAHLKSSNVLLDKDFNPLLMDYALVPVVNPNQVHQILVAYRSPEFAQHGRTSKKTDVWCLGILILETLTGRFVGKYLAQPSGPYGPDLAGWINAIAGEEDSSSVFDKEMEFGKESCRSEMEKLLRIGIACCQEDQDKRWDLEEALRQIELVHEDSSE
ncbi:hypothetical protein BUALT_Bualt07G0177500 [Buddleja alternifolia]|uniref:Protein kinase domain-containing protein n=1 Tax=Buddleja alternifolia TaxID=168488 RepID=A0AAV6XBR8_9LAMI|nr:hypothetical protein BUALT_Bualt07G0177500 [Buddleja alternifolia]